MNKTALETLNDLRELVVILQDIADQHEATMRADLAQIKVRRNAALKSEKEVIGKCERLAEKIKELTEVREGLLQSSRR